MSWSTEQLAAIQARNQNLLVAAAAGSGKTSVLVERIIQRVLDAERPIDIDRMLVVTFTNAAAAEMRERVGAALTDALKKRPDAKYIERQLLLLNSASISTIHSFCQSVIRQNFHLLNLSPKFRVASEVETNLLKFNVLEALFEERYAAGDAGFLNVVEHYGGEKSDDALYGLVLDLYGFSRSHPQPESWLWGLKANFDLPPGTDIETTPWPQIIRDQFTLEVKGLKQRLEDLCRELAQPGSPEVYADVFAADVALLDALLETAKVSWQDLYNAINTCQFVRLPNAGKEVDPDLKEYFQAERGKVKKKIGAYRDDYFARTPEALLEDMRLAAPVVGALAELVNGFAAGYAEAKLKKGLLDFNDLEHYCLQVLSETNEVGELVPSAAAQVLKEKYVEIMVDEYQDTNGVQEAILQMVARTDEPNLFMVGDVKQSIYRFRLAEPELFLQKYRNYGDSGASSCRIDLAKNFRSRACVLSAINYVFRQVMKPDVVELEYGNAECLYPGAEYPPAEQACLEGPVEVLLVDHAKPQEQNEQPAQVEGEEGETEAEAGIENDTADEFSGFELESMLIVRRIKELVESQYCVWDKGAKKYRPLAWRDIVILLRSVRGKAAILLETMRQAGIPAYAELAEGYFQETEVQVILSLLSIVDNPRQDIHLAGVLRSPLGGFNEAELAELRLCDKQGDLWDAVLKAVETLSEEQEDLREKTGEFITRLNRWRSLSRCKGVPELVLSIYRDTGYYDYVGGLPGGVIRQANLRALYDRARQYETTNFRGLFRFLRFVEKLRDKGSDMSVARALGESEDVVRVMSIHKSKGIEFPIVFVADLGKNFNMQDSQQTVLKHKRLGLGVYATPPGVRLKYPTLARHAIAIKQKMETRAEELRILYVALTRAREKLILTASVNNLLKKCRQWHSEVPGQGEFLPDSVIAGARSYLDWLAPALMRHQDGAELVEHIGCVPAEPLLDPEASRWTIQIVEGTDLSPAAEELPDDTMWDKVKKLEPLETGIGTGWVEKVLGWHYHAQLAVDKPAKMSVTEIKRRFESLEAQDRASLYETTHIYDQPRFIQTSSKLTPAEIGTAMHTVMQHLFLTGDLRLQGIEAQVADMVNREILLPEHAASLDLKAVVSFFLSPLGKRLLAAKDIKREVPFSLMLPAAQFYPDMLEINEKIFVQGVIDCMFHDKSGLVLLDYKTDRRQNSAAELKAKYAVQLAVYAQAVQTIFKETVQEKYLYVFSTGEIVAL